MPRRPARRPLAFLALALWGVLALLAACDSQPKTDPERQAKAYALYEGYKKDFPEAAEMRPEEALKLWREGGVVFIDARSEAERAVSPCPERSPNKTTWPLQTGLPASRPSSTAPSATVAGCWSRSLRPRAWLPPIWPPG